MVSLKFFPTHETAVCKTEELKTHLFKKKRFSRKLRVIEQNGFQHLKEHQKVDTEAPKSLPSRIWIFWRKMQFSPKNPDF